jgi:hypothetical protein
MMSTKVAELPMSGSGCGELRIVFDSLDVVVEYEYGQGAVGRVRFAAAIAFRFRDEMHSVGYADGSYDTLVRIDDSTWMRQLGEGEPQGIGLGVAGMTHFAVLFSNNGYLEVIAERAEL